MGFYIGDTPEQLGSYLTADAVILDGKVITRQQVAELIQRNAELVAMVAKLQQSVLMCSELANVDGGTAIDWLIDSCDDLREQAKETPQQCLREIQADIAEKYYCMGWEHSLSTKADDGDHYACGKRLAKEFAESIKAGE